MSVFTGKTSGAGRESDSRAVSPAFLRALGLIKITDLLPPRIPSTSKSFTMYSGKGDRRSRTHAGKVKKSKPKKCFKAKTSAAKAVAVVEECYGVPQSSLPPKKRHLAEWVNLTEVKPVVAVKKSRKPAKPASAKAEDSAIPATCKGFAKPPAPKATVKKKPNASEASSSFSTAPAGVVSEGGKGFSKPDSPKATVKKKPNASEASSSFSTARADTTSGSTGLKDKLRTWVDIVESDFESPEFTKLLRQVAFSEKQINGIQKTFNHLCHIMVKPSVADTHYKTFKCTECNFAVSHECILMNTPEYWTFGPSAPLMQYFKPDTSAMCDCNFTSFHSHNKQYATIKDKLAKSANREQEEGTARSKNTLLLKNSRSIMRDCWKCGMKIVIRNRRNDICDPLTELASIDKPLHKKFYNYVLLNMITEKKKFPPLTEFWSCSTLCCMIFHRCDEGAVQQNCTPLKPLQPSPQCQRMG